MREQDLCQQCHSWVLRVGSSQGQVTRGTMQGDVSPQTRHVYEQSLATHEPDILIESRTLDRPRSFCSLSHSPFCFLDSFVVPFAVVLLTATILKLVLKP